MNILIKTEGLRRRRLGFCLEEVVVAFGISALALGGLVSGYIMASKKIEWSARSMAAQIQAAGRIEQTRAALWDTLADPPTDQLATTNFPALIQPLDLPNVGTNVVLATNWITITQISANPPLKMIRSDCVWQSPTGGIFTNGATAYRSPDQ